jgi:hypothetical protein
MDDNVPDELYKFQDDDLKHLLKEVIGVIFSSTFVSFLM